MSDGIPSHTLLCTFHCKEQRRLRGTTEQEEEEREEERRPSRGDATDVSHILSPSSYCICDSAYGISFFSTFDYTTCLSRLRGASSSSSLSFAWWMRNIHFRIYLVGSVRGMGLVGGGTRPLCFFFLCSFCARYRVLKGEGRKREGGRDVCWEKERERTAELS